MVDDRIEARLAEVYAMSADANLHTVRRDESAIFEKYGPEVYGHLSRVPKNLWTVDNLKRVVNMVKADHVTDIARLEAERMVAEMGGTLRSTGAAPSPGTPQNLTASLQSDKIPSEWKDRATKAGITEATVREFCQANGTTPEQFFAQFDRQVITEVTRRD